MTDSHQKGNALEEAVAAIEAHILEACPALAEETLCIQSKKIITVDGVRHEVDIFVTVTLGQGYDSIFIFECKNQQGPVGKNEIIVFSEKVKATQAQRGFFVAKSFTKDARAQAAKDPRLVLLVVTEHDPAIVPAPFNFHFIHLVPEKVEVTFAARGENNFPGEKLDLDQASAELHGNTTRLGDYITAWASECMNLNTAKIPSHNLSEGIYSRTAEHTRTFPNRELIIDGHEIESSAISVSFSVHLHRPAVLSHFELATRGRIVCFAPITASTGPTMKVRLIESRVPNQRT